MKILTVDLVEGASEKLTEMLADLHASRLDIVGLSTYTDVHRVNNGAVPVLVVVVDA